MGSYKETNKWSKKKMETEQAIKVNLWINTIQELVKWAENRENIELGDNE